MEEEKDVERISASRVPSAEWGATKPAAAAASSDLPEAVEGEAVVMARPPSAAMSSSGTRDLEGALRGSGVGLMETKVLYMSRSEQCARRGRACSKDKAEGVSMGSDGESTGSRASPQGGPPPQFVSRLEGSVSDAGIPDLDHVPDTGKKGPVGANASVPVSTTIERSGDAAALQSASVNGENIRPGAVAVFPTGMSPPQSDAFSYCGNSIDESNPFIDVKAEAHLVEEDTKNEEKITHRDQPRPPPEVDRTGPNIITVASAKRISPIARSVQENCFLVSLASLLVIGGIAGLSAYLSIRNTDHCSGDGCTNSVSGTVVLTSSLESEQPTENPTLSAPPSASLFPSDSPTAIPTIAPTLLCNMPAAMRRDGIANIVQGILQDHSVIRNNATAHSRALKWLAEQDSLHPPLCPQHDSSRLKQRFGLALLHFSLEGERGKTGERGWLYKPSEDKFLEPINECDWAGVDCNLDSQKVRKVELGGRKLRGVLPKELFMIFDDVRVINVQVNRIDGCLPEEVGLASSLESLHLSANALGCTIPSNITDLPSLRILDLSANALFGSIPTLPVNLQRLDLSSNSLNGPLPSNVGNLSQLEKLHLHDNELSSSLPPSIFELPLLSLRLNNNKFDGTVSSAISRLASIEELYLHRNRLSGHIPEELVELPLRVLTLSWNRLKGVLPQQLGQLRNIEVARLEGNRINGAFPASAAQLSKLGVLFIQKTKIRGIIDDGICALKTGGGNVSGSLRILKATCSEDSLCDGDCGVCCSCCDCVDCDDDASGGYSSGKSCYPYEEGEITDIDDDTGKSLSRSDVIRQKIVQFNVSEESALSQPSSPQGMAASWLIDEDELKIDPSDPSLFQRYAMAVLYFATEGKNWLQCSATGASECGSGNFEGKAPFLSNVSSCDWAGIRCYAGVIKEIRLEYNSLRGTLPTKELSGLCLSRLILKGNTGLSIDLTSRYCDRLFSGLSKLDLSENSLTGKLSKALFRPRGSVYLNDNRLSGSLPSVEYSHLYSLRLQYNDITGTIPAELGSESSRLKELRLDNNFLVGTVPNSFGELVGLKDLTLHNNQLSGTITDALCDLSYDNGGILEHFWADCGGGTGVEIECHCCSKCF